VTDAAYMARALELAARARGRTAPNPMVGAVIARNGELLAEGWHHALGQAHGEADALSKLGGRAPGATLYVTLEPCCHHGRTPPCTDAVLASGVTRVVAAMVDPDPRVAGKGIEILRQAGIDVEVGVLEAESRRLNRGYVLARTEGRPAITIKSGITLDGRIASAYGESRWITSEEGRRAGHRLRDEHDAILAGRRTVAMDDPQLTTRLPGGRDALPVVLDSRLELGPERRVFHGSRRAVVYALTGERELPADVVKVAPGRGGVDVRAVLTDLVARGVHSVLVEGGGIVIRSFLDEGLVDRIELFVSPKVLGTGPGWVGGDGFHLADAPTFAITDVVRVGPDLRMSLERA
jgi:diaminohydroxyphosphoribosylaminopyrimidine deaminase / 5-amino-6-(5-phosphoribosylamino)uracil reductase